MRRAVAYACLAAFLVLSASCDREEECASVDGAWFFTCMNWSGQFLLDVEQTDCNLEGVATDPVQFPDVDWLTMEGEWNGQSWHVKLYDNIQFPGAVWVECEGAVAGRVFECEDKMLYPGAVQYCAFWTSP